MKIRFLLCILFFALSTAVHGQEGSYYKVITMRAAPGKLLQLIEELKVDIRDHQKFGMQEPFLMRHSQGDQWDLLLIYPIDTEPGTYFSSQAADLRSQSRTQDQSYDSVYFDLISFQEEQIVNGPPQDLFNKNFSTFGYYHVEIFHALAGKRKPLLEQRQMENKFLEELGRKPNFIFTKVFGGEADCFTIGFYENIKDYAASSDTPEEAENQAAIKAGFESVNTIGSYLRSLINTHHDTLAGAVRAN